MRKNYEDLGNAVVLQAVKDYRKAKKKLRKYPNNDDAISVIEQVTRFLLSDRLSMFTELDGTAILRILNKEDN